MATVVHRIKQLRLLFFSFSLAGQGQQGQPRRGRSGSTVNGRLVVVFLDEFKQPLPFGAVAHVGNSGVLPPPFLRKEKGTAAANGADGV